jgi:N-acetylglucosaminyldiphosphoundecaprenol N-acetyl-beta-D-mannosaminyltransferase
MTGYEVTHIGDISVIALPARTSVGNAKQLLDAVQRELQTGRRRIFLDLRKTLTVDSTALGAIVQLARAAAGRGGELTLLGPNEGVRRVLAITRLDSILGIRASMPVDVGSLSP